MGSTPSPRRALHAAAISVGTLLLTVGAAVVAMLALFPRPAEAGILLDCAVGEYFEVDECLPIPLGSEGTEGDPDGTGSTDIATCPVGEYRSDPDSTFCIAIPLGSGGTGGAPDGTGSTGVAECVAGTFRGDAATTSCSAAGVGSYVSTVGATAQTAIPLGSGGTGGASDGTGSTGVAECVAGTFRGDAATTSCNAAGVGSYVSTVGATAQTAIPLGSGGTGGASDGTGSTGRDECEPGTYRGDATTTSCRDAEAGHFVAALEATEQTPCAAGTFQAGTGRTSCDPAPRGSHVPTEGATTSALCPAGTYTASTGQSTCTPAAVGYYVPRPGASEQLRCLTATETGLSRCPAPTATPAPPRAETPERETGDEPLSPQGDACAPGTWSTTGTSRGGTSCTPASPGAFVAGSGATAEEPCPPGAYSDTFGATECTPAPVGTFVATAGAMDPTPCPGATEPGATECPETFAAPVIEDVLEPAGDTSAWWWIGGLALVLAAGGAGFVLLQRRTGTLTASIDGDAGAGAATLTAIPGLDTTGTARPATDTVAPAGPDALEWDEALDGRPDDEAGPPLTPGA